MPSGVRVARPVNIAIIIGGIVLIAVLSAADRLDASQARIIRIGVGVAIGLIALAVFAYRQRIQRMRMQALTTQQHAGNTATMAMPAYGQGAAPQDVMINVPTATVVGRDFNNGTGGGAYPAGGNPPTYVPGMPVQTSVYNAAAIGMPYPQPQPQPMLTPPRDVPAGYGAYASPGYTAYNAPYNAYNSYGAPVAAPAPAAVPLPPASVPEDPSHSDSRAGAENISRRITEASSQAEVLSAFNDCESWSMSQTAAGCGFAVAVIARAANQKRDANPALWTPDVAVRFGQLMQHLRSRSMAPVQTATL